MAGAVTQAGYGPPVRQEDRHDDDGGDGHLAIHADDERFVTSALEDIQRRFNNGALHELFGYILKVPVTISPQHKLGLYLRNPSDSTESKDGSADCDKVKAVLLDNTLPGESPYPSTEVMHVDVDPACQLGEFRLLQSCEDQVDGLTSGSDELEIGMDTSGDNGGASMWLMSVEVCLNGRVVAQEFGQNAVLLIQKVQESKQRARLVLCFFKQQTYSFQYKARTIRGNALHVLSLAQRHQLISLNFSDEIFDTLINVDDGLESNLEIEWWQWLDSECEFRRANKIGTCQALHLASGRGNVDFLGMLLEAAVDVNAKTRWTGKENYTALHEACFFNQTRAVRFLVECGAKVNETNLHSLTPLHIAAAQGGYRCCRYLVKAQADVKQKDNSKRTPLDAAMEGGRFSHYKLFHLTGRTFNDLLQVAHHSPAAASDLLRHVTQDTIHESWSTSLAEEMSSLDSDGLSKWIALLGLAPKAGEEVIEALTRIPVVKDESHHPLPRRVSMPPGVHFLCQYQPEDTWDYFSEANKTYPDWHKDLCPGCEARLAPKALTNRTDRWLRQVYARATGQSADAYARNHRADQIVPSNNIMEEVSNLGRTNKAQTDLVPVKVVIVMLPGIICPMVMYVLSTISDRHIFVKIGVRAIVEYVWTNLVRYQYYNKTSQRFAVIILFFCFVSRLIPEDPGSLLRRGCWSMIAAQAYHEIFYEVFECLGHCFLLKLPEAYFGKLKNICDYGSAALGLSLMHLTQHDFHIESWPVLLAITVMGRWVMFTWTCRAFAWAGEKILPVLQASAMPMGGILLVCGLTFGGFWHAFAALTLAQSAQDQFNVLLATLRLLVLGDGDGAAVIIGLYNGDEELGSPITFILFSVAVIAFCICLLNLFIAVHGEAYDKAQETAHISFLQERSAICLNCLLMPKWPPSGCCKFSNPRRASVCIYVLSLIAWAVLISLRQLHPLIASFTLLAGSLLADSVLLQLPWNKEDSRKYHFWICHRDDDDEKFAAAPEDSDLPGRLSSVRQNSVNLNARVTENLRAFQNKVQDRHHSLEQGLTSLDQRLRAMETRLEYAHTALSRAIPPVLE